jgi:hypothetical protein
MTACIGIMGKIFGHNFSEMLIEYIPWTPSANIKNETNLARSLEALATRKYKIICTRCGEERE